MSEPETKKNTECNCPTTDVDTGVTEPTKKPTYIVPPIGSVGTFQFEEPFSNNLGTNVIYEVKAIRSLKEMCDSEEKPFENIYDPLNLTEKDFKTDLDWNVPIIVLSNAGGNYFYVPASKLKSLPKVSGVKYQQLMLGINLGYLPVGYNIDLIKNKIIEDIKEMSGITTDVKAIKASAVQLVTQEEHDKYKKQLETNKKDKQSYKVKYTLLLEKFNKTQDKLRILCNCVKNHVDKGLPVVPQQPPSPGS